MKSIVGSPARVEAIDQAAIEGPELQLIAELAASAGNRQKEFPVINRYMRTLIKHAALFKAQVAMGVAIFRGEIPPRERELAVLRVAWLCGAPYEWGEHVGMAKRCGLSAREIEQVIEGASCAVWSPLDRAIITGAEELVLDHMITDETWAVLASHWTERQLIEFPVMVGQYITTACVQNSLRVPLAKHNTGLALR